MALILVLSVIVLLTILVVGFMIRAGVERTSSSNYLVTASVQRLSETAVNLVQGQINHATTQSTVAVPYAWASQPGAIRLFNADGTLKLIYRLYSANTMTTNVATDLANDIPPAAWAASPALWADLNSPVTATDTASGTQLTSYPILDARDPADTTKLITTGNTHAMEGFNLTTPPGATTLQPAPMPVRWLYVLQKGEIIAPDAASTSTVAKFTTAATKPDKDNPIVGRIAFWTDDESCKLNINTASGGDATFWDSPHFNYPDDRDSSGKGLALYQPASGEYQRYPGHPATTTLNKVFLSIDPTLASTSALFNFLPRYTYGGSKEATLSVSTATSIPKKSDRLFSSVGELLFDKSRNPNGLTRQQLETARFFLTTHSRAPEVNLFGKPRISIWPEPDDTTKRTVTDKLIAFCSTANGFPYYFTRKSNTSSTTDLNLTRNQSLLSFLDTETSSTVPGFGGDFKTKYGTDQRQIVTEIFDYIRTINLRDSSSGATPYADTSSTATDASGTGQVIPTINSSWGTQGIGRFARISEASMLLIGMGRGKTTTPASAAIPVDSLQTPAPPSGLTPPDNTTDVQGFFLLNFFDPAHGYSRMTPSFTIRVGGLNAFKLEGQDMGMPTSATMYISASPAGSPSSPSWMSVAARSGLLDFRCMMGNRLLGTNVTTQFPFYSKMLEIPKVANSTPAGTVTLGAANLTIEVFAGNSTATADLIQTYAINFPSQVMPVPGVEPTGTATHRRFGVSASPPPVVVPPVPSPAGTWDRVALYNTQDYGLYMYMVNVTTGSSDTVFSMVPDMAWGDYRLMSVSSVPSTAFVAHPNAGGTGKYLAYGFRTSGGTLLTGATSGKLVVNANVSVADATSGLPARPDAVSPKVNGAYVGGGASGTPGDWDNGVADSPDGPYINKADEGSIFRGVATTSIPYWGNGNFLTTEVGTTFFSPNRQVPSPGIFGSLPTGVLAHKPWQTLLFRPGPTGHPGIATPKDHLWMDLFWMPVAEPYAISEPFSTAGKVNLNYQIVPFTYITRNTALRSVLASEKIAQIPKYKAAYYKAAADQNTGNTARWPIYLSETDGALRQFKEKFAANDIFRSATEICDIYLPPVPTDDGSFNWASNTAAQNAWYNMGNTGYFSMVGDNVREKPYTDIYPRVTTKSNIYTVYYTTQTLKTPSTASPAQWDEAVGTVSGEYRGSTTLERYIDPNNTSIPDYATDTNAALLDTFYKWRVVNNTQFAP